jgi:D-alanine-D-alanine ligase
MKIAYTYNLQLTDSEEDAAFDRPETVEAIAGALTALGHQVERVEVSGPASRLVARLEAMNPDLIFNTAVGRGGKSREAFYPGLFEQLGMPYTGSDAYTCTLTTDKRLTKMLVAASGVPTPRWVFVESVHNWTQPDLTYPVMIKPNYEGSSKGIDQQSIVEAPDQLLKRVTGLLIRYPAGVLIEEFIEGKDVIVPFLEKASRKTGGILAPGEYRLTLRWFRATDMSFMITTFSNCRMPSLSRCRRRFPPKPQNTSCVCPRPFARSWTFATWPGWITG